MTASPAPRRGGPPAIVAYLAIGGLVLMVLATVLTLVGGPGAAPAASPTIRPAGLAAEQTAGAVTQALGAASFQVSRPQSPYRPPEVPPLFEAPRLVLQAVLAEDPGGGFLIIYELPDTAQAVSVGRQWADYLGSGVGRVQFPIDTRFVLRRVGSTLVFFHWSPENSPDPRTADLAAAIATVGEDVPVPR